MQKIKNYLLKISISRNLPIHLKEGLICFCDRLEISPERIALHYIDLIKEKFKKAVSFDMCATKEFNYIDVLVEDIIFVLEIKNLKMEVDDKTKKPVPVAELEIIWATLKDSMNDRYIANFGLNPLVK